METFEFNWSLNIRETVQFNITGGVECCLPNTCPRAISLFAKGPWADLELKST